MNKNHVVANTLFAIACVVFLNTKSFADTPPILYEKSQIQAYHDSGAYDKALAKTISRAQQYINQRAISNSDQLHPEKLAVVLDIDETSLTNYNRMLARNFSNEHKKIHQDILAADAPAIKPMLSLYHDALAHNVAVFFVTGRNKSEFAATTKNLKSAGYNTWSGLYLRPSNYKQASIVPFKSSARANITKQGYTIIASLGDQKSDFKGGYTEKSFKLPNPYYFIP